MRIADLKLTKENIPIAVSAAVILILVVVYIIFYIPLIATLRARHSECVSKEKQIVSARQIMAAGKIMSERMLLTERDSSVAMDELTKHGKEAGIIFRSIKPREIAADQAGQYKILPIEMDIEADYQHVSAFIGSLDELNKGLIRIKSFDVAPLKDDLARLSAKLTVEMYFSTKDYEE